MKPKLYYSIRGQAVVGPEHREEWKEQLPNYMKSSQSNGKDIEEARNKAYQNVEKIKFEGVNYRHDIGLDLMKL